MRYLFIAAYLAISVALLVLDPKRRQLLWRLIVAEPGNDRGSLRSGP